MRERRHLRRAGGLEKSCLGARPTAELVGADTDVELHGGSGHSSSLGIFEGTQRRRVILRSECLLAGLELLQRCGTVGARQSGDQKYDEHDRERGVQRTINRPVGDPADRDGRRADRARGRALARAPLPRPGVPPRAARLPRGRAPLPTRMPRVLAR